MDDIQKIIDLTAEGMQETASGLRALDKKINELDERLATQELANRLLAERVEYLERALEYHTVREHEDS